MFKTLKDEMNNKSSSESVLANKTDEQSALRQPNVVSARNSVEENMEDLSRISSKGKLSEAIDFSNLQCSMDQEKLVK